MLSDRHADSRMALTHFLASGDRTRSIVITHHAPSIRSLPEHKHAEPIRAAYASNMEDLIVANGLAVWVHGHIHHPRDYTVGSTRIVIKALGEVALDRRGRVRSKDSREVSCATL